MFSNALRPPVWLIRILQNFELICKIRIQPLDSDENWSQNITKITKSQNHKDKKTFSKR